MKINLNKAVSTFYPNPSFEQVFFEAIANAIDADATSIAIRIKIDAFDKPDTLKVVIKDNGHGFRDADFAKFSSLLEADSKDHKGLGRLVYLAYFREVKFESNFNGEHLRTFNFSGKFSGKSRVTEQKGPSGTTITYKHFSGERIKAYAYLVPARIKDAILQHFFPTLFNRSKQPDKPLEIAIALDAREESPEHGFVSGEAKLTLADLPELKHSRIENSPLDFFQSIDIYYSIKRDIEKEKSLTSSICVDGRTLDLDLVPAESIPTGHQLVFLFLSDYFAGKTNASRQKLELPDQLTDAQLRNVLRKEVGRIISSEIPTVVDENAKTRKELSVRYPHLEGYDALIQDAESRNATFVRILRSRIAHFIRTDT